MSSQNSSINVSVTKHNGLGNDFLVLDRREASALSNAQVAEIDWPNMARNWCNRKTGVGADGLLLLGRVSANTLTMRLFNSDGSLAEMSGNGIHSFPTRRSSDHRKSVV